MKKGIKIDISISKDEWKQRFLSNIKPINEDVEDIIHMEYQVSPVTLEIYQGNLEGIKPLLPILLLMGVFILICSILFHTYEPIISIVFVITFF